MLTPFALLVLAAAAEEPPPPPAPAPPLAGLEESLRQFAAFGAGTKDAAGSFRFLWGADAVLWDRRNARHSGLEGGEAEFRLEGWWRSGLRARVALDLLGEDTADRLSEAWVALEPEAGPVHLRAGLQRLALGTEGATDVEVLPLPGRSFAAAIDARTDLALSVDAATEGGFLWAGAAAFAGHGFLEDGTPVGSPGAQARVVLRPFRLGGEEAAAAAGLLGGLHAGAGLARLLDFDDPVVAQTPLGSTVFRTTDLDGRAGTRLHLEAGAALGPVALGLETARGAAADAARPGGPRADVDELTAWSASAAWRITGEPWEWERGAWRGAGRPGARGTWELALRYSNSDLDRDLFRRGFTTYDPSSQETRTFSAMIGWRPAEGMRIALGWVRTIADEALTAFGSGPGPRTAARSSTDGRDSSFVLRIEVGF